MHIIDLPFAVLQCFHLSIKGSGMVRDTLQTYNVLFGVIFTDTVANNWLGKPFYLLPLYLLLL